MKESDRSKIPIEIFGTELSPAEALVKYLKEQRGMNYSQIGKAINRDKRGLWGAYNRAQKKQTGSFLVHPSKMLIPISIFTDRNYAILERLVLHLKEEQGVRMGLIAEILDKTKSTVWTVYNRARKKREQT